MRTAEAQRHAEALRAAHHDVGALLAGRRQHAARQQIGGDCCDGASVVQGFDHWLKVADGAAAAGICQQRAVHLAGAQLGRRIADDEVDAQRSGACGDHVDDLRVAVGVDEEAVWPAACNAAGLGHRLGRRGAFAQQR